MPTCAQLMANKVMVVKRNFVLKGLVAKVGHPTLAKCSYRFGRHFMLHNR